LAICKAISHILLLSSPHSRYILFSDSLSVLTSLDNSSFNPKSHPLIYNIRALLWRLSRSGVEVILHWIPSHVGISLNEAADQLAREASVDGHPSYTSYFPDFLPLCSRILYDVWRSDWANLCTTAHYRAVQSSLPPHPWFYKSKFSRHFISTICRLRSGHCHLPFHLHRINLAPHPFCPYHTDHLYEADINHVFFNCSHFSTLQFHFSSELILLGYYPPFSIQNLLSFNDIQVLNLIYSFIRLSSIIL